MCVHVVVDAGDLSKRAQVSVVKIRTVLQIPNLSQHRILASAQLLMHSLHLGERYQMFKLYSDCRDEIHEPAFFKSKPFSEEKKWYPEVTRKRQIK